MKLNTIIAITTLLITPQYLFSMSNIEQGRHTDLRALQQTSISESSAYIKLCKQEIKDIEKALLALKSPKIIEQIRQECLENRQQPTLEQRQAKLECNRQSLNHSIAALESVQSKIAQQRTTENVQIQQENQVQQKGCCCIN